MKKLYGTNIWHNLPYIVQESVLKYAYSAARTKGEIASFLGTTQVEGNVMFAVAAVVSATVPLFILVMFFQRQIVSGLTAGAVKG